MMLRDAVLAQNERKPALMHPLLNPDQQQPPTYSLAERDRRWALARQLMDAEQVDALLIYGEREGTGPAPFAPDTYFTNDRPGALVIFPRNGEPVALYDIPEMAIDHLEARRRGEEVWLQPENVRVGRFGPQIVEALQDYGLGQSKIGVLGFDPYPPFYFTGALVHGIWQAITTQLPEVRLTSVWRRFYMMTVSQSDEELAVIAWAARVGERMAQAMLETVHPDVKESDLYAAAMYTALSSGVVSPGILFAAICGAVLGLARTGILNERQHTGNTLVELQQAASY